MSDDERTAVLSRARASLLCAERAAQVLDHVADGVITATPDGIIVFVNQAAAEVFGYAAGELVGEDLSVLLPDDVRADHAQWLRDFAYQAASRRDMGEWGRVRARRADGSEFPALAAISRVDTEVGVLCTVALRDVTERLRLERELDERRRFSRAVLDAIGRPMGVLDRHGLLIDANSAWHAQVDADRYPEVRPLGTAYVPVLEAEPAVAADLVPVLLAIEAVVSDGTDEQRVEYTVPGPDAEAWHELTVEPLETTEGGAVVSVEDITDRKRAELRLAHRAAHDELTGALTRSMFYQRLERMLAEPPPDGAVAVVIFDLDGFKAVNDRRGHLVGDRLLVHVVGHMRRVITSGDTLARLGGDEFALLTIDHGGGEAEGAAARLLRAVRTPLRLGDEEIAVDACAGVTVAEGGSGQDAWRLMHDADEALYRAKAAGRGSVRRATGRSSLSSPLGARLRAAITAEELELAFQPIHRLADGRSVGAEALVRWRDAHVGRLRLPGEFLSAAEQAGALPALGRWVLARACADAARRDPTQDGSFVAVNLSGIELADPSVVDHVCEALTAAGLPPGRLSIELTERALLDRSEVRSNVLAIARLGVGLALDDFGTGYASLVVLQRLPIDVLKIDRSFVAAMLDDERSAELVRASIGLARSLGMQCTAEGVEREEQARALRDLGCDLAQGHLFAPARVPTAALTPSAG